MQYIGNSQNYYSQSQIPDAYACSDTYDFSRGWALGSHSGLLSAAVGDASEREFFSLLGGLASKEVEAVLFLPPSE